MAEASGNAGMAPERVPGRACRINALSDDVLLGVLSHMNALEVVQTSVLSRRWRGLWRSVPRINATRDEFYGVADTDEERDAMFRAFVSRFLMLRNPTPLKVFDLEYCLLDDEDVDYAAESEDANLWIGHALQCNATSIKVLVSDARMHLDSSVFATKRCLKSLELSSVILFPGFFKKLQQGCTVLDWLILRSCSISDPEISSQTLKVLIVDTLCRCTFQGQGSICIPSLIRLHFHCPDKVELLNMELLVAASVTVGDHGTQVDDINHFLRSLSGVNDLEFYYEGKTLKMEKNFQWCPKFNNLTILTLGEWCLCENFYALIVFLQNSPNLVKLILELIKSEAAVKTVFDTGEKFIGDLEERSFTCERLKTVEIICLKRLEDDPMVNDLEKLLTENGITSGQIEIMSWN